MIQAPALGNWSCLLVLRAFLSKHSSYGVYHGHGLIRSVLVRNLKVVLFALDLGNQLTRRVSHVWFMAFWDEGHLRAHKASHGRGVEGPREELLNRQAKRCVFATFAALASTVASLHPFSNLHSFAFKTLVFTLFAVFALGKPQWHLQCFGALP